MSVREWNYNINEIERNKLIEVLVVNTNSMKKECVIGRMKEDGFYFIEGEVEYEIHNAVDILKWRY